MINIRPASLNDIEQIQHIEKEYYEGYSCPEDTLKSWISQHSESFFIAEKDGKLVGFLFFEYLNQPEALPFVHELRHNAGGKYCYVSEIGVIGWDKGVAQQLFDAMLEKAKQDGCEKIIWLTGIEMMHDKMELELLENNGFKQTTTVSKWEAFPDHFVSDHSIWDKSI